MYTSDFCHLTVLQHCYRGRFESGSCWQMGGCRERLRQSVIRTYQVKAAGSWPASCCPLQPCCCYCCCCPLAGLLPSPSCTRRQTDTGCTASWASWRCCWMYPRSGCWTAHATSCSCLPESENNTMLGSKVIGTHRNNWDNFSPAILVVSAAHL